MTLRRVLLVVMLLLLASCRDHVPSTALPVATNPPLQADPQDLVGRWAVSAKGVGTGVVLVLRGGTSLDDSWSVRERCGTTGGSWTADGEQSLFLALPAAGSGNCFTYPAQTLEWITGATRFRVEGSHRRLLDPAGRSLATLTPAGPSATKTSSTGDAQPQSFAQPAPLPRGVAAPTQQQLKGRWLPVDRARASTSFQRFDSAGGWTGNDGCQGARGRYVLGQGGRWLALGGVLQNLMGCEVGRQGITAPLVTWATQAGRVGRVGEQPVFYDAGGKELGRVNPAG